MVRIGLTDAFLHHTSKMLSGTETTYLNTRKTTFGRHCCKIRTHSISWANKRFCLWSSHINLFVMIKYMKFTVFIPNGEYETFWNNVSEANFQYIRWKSLTIQYIIDFSLLYYVLLLLVLWRFLQGPFFIVQVFGFFFFFFGRAVQLVRS